MLNLLSLLSLSEMTRAGTRSSWSTLTKFVAISGRAPDQGGGYDEIRRFIAFHESEIL